MAYAAAVTWRIEGSPKSGARTLHIRVVETDAAAASAWSTSNAVPVAGVTVTNIADVLEDVPMFRRGEIISTLVDLVSGTGTTVAPRAGRVAAWADSTQNQVYVISTAADFHHYSTPVPFALTTPTSTAAPVLPGASVVDAGTDNVVHTELLIREIL